VEEDAIYPYYVTAMSTGQSVMYLTNQSDGIQNNAPIMGSFTSLFIDANLSSLVVTAQTYPQIIKNSITITVGGIFPNTYNILTSNLSESTLQTIYSNVTTIDSVLSTRTNHDINYFRNANIVLDEMDSLLIFTGMGETAEKLVDEFIGTPKLLSRINA
jgi:pantothenate kinase